jgi:hypothetical protein
MNRGFVFQKTAFFIVIAVKPSNVTNEGVISAVVDREPKELELCQPMIFKVLHDDKLYP